MSVVGNPQKMFFKDPLDILKASRIPFCFWNCVFFSILGNATGFSSLKRLACENIVYIC